MSKGGRRVIRKAVNPNNFDLILKETFKKEIKYVKLYTEFSPNYVKMGDIVTGKITECDKSMLSNDAFGLIDACESDTYRTERNNQLTTSSEYGSFPGSLVTQFAPTHHSRIKCDITKLAEDQFRILKALKRDEVKVDPNKKVEEFSENVADAND